MSWIFFRCLYCWWSSCHREQKDFFFLCDNPEQQRLSSQPKENRKRREEGERKLTACLGWCWSSRGLTRAAQDHKWSIKIELISHAPESLVVLFFFKDVSVYSSGFLEISLQPLGLSFRLLTVLTCNKFCRQSINI